MLLTAYSTKLLLARTILTPLIICCQGQLCVEEEPRTKAQQEREAFRRAIVDEKDIETLVRGMAKYLSDPAIQEWACNRLRQLANIERQLEIANLGGVQAILQAMKVHATEAKVQKEACDALSSLGNNDDNMVTIANLGGIQAILKTMKEHPSEEEVQANACTALNTLSWNDENTTLIKKEGGGEAVRRAMAAPNATDYTRDWGQKVLDKLALC